MKSPALLSIAALYLFASFGCKKTELSTPGNGDVTRSPTIKANAGANISVYLPTKNTFLKGSYIYTGSGAISANWTKLDGPSSLEIENANALETKVDNLEEGLYHFELTVKDARGISDRDTLRVNVHGAFKATIGANELLYDNMEWIQPWYYALEVKDFALFMPSGRSYKIYIKRDDSSDWVEVKQSSSSNDQAKYESFVETRPDGGGMYNFRSLYIFYYGLDVDDSPSVKIQF